MPDLSLSIASARSILPRLELMLIRLLPGRPVNRALFRENHLTISIGLSRAGMPSVSADFSHKRTSTPRFET